MTTSEPRIPALPERIGALATLATNLWWSWSRDARNLFRSIDALLWHRTRHNPIALLQLVAPARLTELAGDEEFLLRLDRVRVQLEQALSGEGTWFRTTYPELTSRPVAYFCAEFGLHNSVPIYSGGLGVLAGDHCKASSDLGIPLVCVGLLYSMGFFDQRMRLDGWQEDSDDPLDPTITALIPLLDESGAPHLVTVPLSGRTLRVGAWRMMVGAVPVYLLDTNLEVNDPDDRSLSSKLYAGGPEMRIRQEWVLGVGGVRLLRKLGIETAAWHANEGHAVFMLVERVRELLAQGRTLTDAVAQVRASSSFTTHTPVPAGHDVFGRGQVAQCIAGYLDGGELDEETFFSLGHHPQHDHGTYHMTAAGIRLAGRVNGVSRLHGEETRRVWRVLWPERELEKVPVTHVTNGVHLATWMANPMMDMLDRELGDGWGSRLEDPALLERVLDLDAVALWNVHVRLKSQLLEYVREEARRRWRRRWKEPRHLVASGTLLSPEALTIGFARRFATYKRADLVFMDPDRLRNLVTDERRPVQIVFAGKAHPADEDGKRILQQVYRFANDPEFEGRIAFLENYDMHVAHWLVQGVDLWLNLPRVPLEACGTSGMKAGLNAVPQLGTLDGWWAEGSTGKNGWCIPIGPREGVDAHDAGHVYELLKEEIAPAFFERDERDVPVRWVQTMRHALKETLGRFTARTMLRRYAHDFYVPSMRGERPPPPPTAE
jgi:starch phosphorylase